MWVIAMPIVRPIAAVALLGALLAPLPVSADDAEVDAAPTAAELENAPLSLRGTRGAPHPDCSNNVPQWEHAIQAGEHLGLIAGRYGVRRADLIELNGIEDPNLIRTGQTLKICPEIAPRQTKQVTHVVGKGETLSGIAAKYALGVDELLDRAGVDVSDRNVVRVGQTFSFWVDDGLVEAFRPPLPKPKKAKKKKKGGKGRLRHAKVDVQLQASKSIYIKRPRLAYGTAKTIRLLGQVVTQYKGRYAKGPKVLIGNISARGGGKLHPHLSHRKGVDIDVGYVLRGEAAKNTRFSGVNSKNFDSARTWALVKAFVDTGQIRYIFMDYAHQKTLYEYAKGKGVSEDELDELFQYPRGRGRSHGLIRHWRSHKNHFHVRFK